MRVFAMLLGATVWTTAASECLSVVEHDAQPLKIEFGITNVEWRAVWEARGTAFLDHCLGVILEPINEFDEAVRSFRDDE